jgi:hypothetical protein
MPQTGSLTGRHHGHVKSQQRRDEEAVTIFAGLLLFALVMGAGAVVLVLAHRYVTLDGDVLNVLAYAVLGCAVVALIRYIYRHRRP